MSRKTPISLTLLAVATMAVGPLSHAHATATPSDPVRISLAKKINGRLSIQSVTAPSAADAARMAKQLSGTSNVVAAAVDRRVRAATIDPRFPEQYGLNLLNAGRTWSYPDAKGAIVAVIDSGVDGNHPDLAGRVMQGAEFLQGGQPTSTGNGWNAPYFHGTAVAGVIGATVNNGIGIAGLARNVRILPVRVLDDEGMGYGSDVATSIVWAADHGAKVINLSLGAASPSDVERAAADYARSKGAVVVASAGNQAQSGNPVTYPAAYPGVIAVSAYDATRRAASFSEHGSFVTLSAPGVGILSTTTGGRYTVASGTSFSAPFVSATAALLAGNAPRLSAAQIAGVLTRTATDLGSPGRDDYYGYGSVNPSAALAAVTQPVAPSVALAGPSSSMVGSRVGLTATVNWVAPGTSATLQRYSAGAWRTVGSTGVSWTGATAFSPVAPSSGTAISYRVLAAGRVSATRTVRLTPVPARQVSTSAPTSITSGSAPVSVAVSGGRTVSGVGITVAYLAPRSTTWRTLGSYRTGSNGRFVLSVGLGGRGTWQFHTTADGVTSRACAVRY